MKSEIVLTLVTYLMYIIIRNLNLLVHIGYTLLAFVVLRFFPDRCKTLIQVTLLWHVFELIDAFVINPKYDKEYKCTHTASVSNKEMTDDEVLEPSLSEKDSPSSSSQPRTDESTPLQDSTSTLQSTDAR